MKKQTSQIGGFSFPILAWWLAGAVLAAMPSPAWAVLEYDNANSSGYEANVPATAVNLLAAPGTTLTLSGGAPATPTGEEGTSTSWTSLTDGTFGGAGGGSLGTKVTIHNGWILTYTFATNYDLAAIDVFSGWQDNGRMQPNCTVKYATDADPNTFIALQTINYTPGGVNSAWVRLTKLKINAKAIQFEFGAQQNGYVGYAELAVQAAAPNVDPTLVAWYTFNNTAIDLTGNGNDGTLVGTPGYVPGNSGQALNFTASASQWVSVPYNAALALNTFTVSAWVNVNTPPGTYAILGTRIGGEQTFDLKVAATSIHADVGSGSGWINTGVDINNVTFATGTWHLVTYVVNDATKQFVLYLDGTPRRTIGYSGTPLLMQPGQTLGIGNDYGGGEYMDGKLDDVRIYSRALTSADVESLYAGTSPWTSAPWSDDASAGVNAAYNYTHAFNFGQEDALINNVMFTHLWTGNPGVPGRFQTAAMPNQFPNDTGNNLTGGGSRKLANDFLYNGNPESLTLSGLIPGRQYVLSFFSTAWDGTPGERLILFSNGAGTSQRVIDQDAYRTPSARGGIVISYTYTATQDTETFTMTPASGGSFHCYGFANREATVATNNPWTYAQWTTDASSGVNPAYNYTHAYNFGSAANATINTITFTGVGGANPSVAGRFATAGLGNGPVGDGGKVTGGGSVLAGSFIYGGDPETLSLQGLTPGKAYVLSIFATAWEAPGNRFISFSGAGGQRTIDQDSFASAGIVISYAYTADSSGTVTVQLTPLIPGNTCHFYGFANRETIPIPIPASITLQPQGISVAQGLGVSFRVEAIGEPAPAFLWLKNGAPLVPNVTTATLNLTAVTAADAGNYQAVVTNSGAVLTSVVATLEVGLPMTNPSFEVDSFPTAVGYISQNFPITGWTHTLANRIGINPIADGQQWFTDNGIIPHGRQAAFLQEGSLSTTISGLTIGQDYYVEYAENARNCCGGTAGLALTVSDGVNPALTIMPAHPVTPVGGSNPYHEVTSYGFVATATTLTLTFTKTDAVAGDSTALIDNVRVLPLPAGTPPRLLLQPQSGFADQLVSASIGVVASGSSPLHYQWRKNGADLAGANAPQLTLNNVTLNDEADYALVVTNSAGSVTSATARLTVIVPLADLFNTGVDSSRAPVAGGAADPHYTLVVNPDSASPEALVINGGFPIAPDGPWMANSAASKWIGPRAETSGAAGGDYTYSLIIDLTGRDPDEVFIQGNWTSDNGGPNIAVNGVDTGNTSGGGFGGWYPFVLASTNATFVTGVNTIDFKVNNAEAGFTGLRVEFTRSHARIAAGSAPAMILQPQGGLVSLGDLVELSGNAIGSAPLYYQWFKNGTPLPGQNGPLLALPNFSPADSADYTLVVTNGTGSATSSVATVRQIYLPMTTLFNTGVDENRAVAASGSSDLHYALIASPDPVYVGPAAVVLYNNVWPVGGGTYVGNGPSSAWISPTLNGTNLAGGSYVYKTTFQISDELDWTAAWINGKWASDNDVLDVRLNGVSLGLSNNAGFVALSPFTISSGFKYGTNTLEFVVGNGADSPHAFRVELKGGALTNPPFAPAVSIPPQTQLGQQGKDVWFTVATTNGHPTWYQWYFEGFALPGENGSVLHLSAVNKFDQEGSYWVIMTNRFGAATSGVAVLTINLPPEAMDTDLGARNDQPAALSAAKLLALCSDPEGDQVTLLSVSNSTNGAVVSIADGNIVYSPVPGYAGADQFAFTVVDARGGTATRQVTVVVSAGNVPSLNMLARRPLAGGVQITFAGIPGRSYGFERALSVHGPWTNIATVVALPNGITPFLDTNPPPVQAFYRTVSP